MYEILPILHPTRLQAHTLTHSLSVIFAYSLKQLSLLHSLTCLADIRTEAKFNGWSINIALSTRGRVALDAVGLEKAVSEGCKLFVHLLY